MGDASGVDTVGADDSPATSSSFARVDRGDIVGRYVLLDEIGRGGMGVVYAAFDPELDRKVAIKLLRTDRDDEELGSARLVREAQAMARLAHPNAVAVYDVGTFREHVFVAMEFVEGTTLRAWSRAHPRTWREIVHVMVAAGRGLAAAHAAGLVHGDFKPDNVMIDRGEHGRVRVMDFGLARRAGDRSLDPSQRPTATARVTGTPGYLAPERLAGRSGDARSDQFAFAVTLWELRYRERPFAGSTPLEISTRVLAGELSAPPRTANVPGRLRPILARALALDPGDRFSSLGDMLAALERDPSRARLVVAGAIAACALGLGALAWQRLDTARSIATCSRAGEAIDDLWNDGRREAVRAAIHGSGAGNAETTWDKLAPQLDAYAQQWKALRTDVCIAADVDRTLTAEQRRRSDECLDELQFELAALVGVLADADADVAQLAVPSVAALDRVDLCIDDRALAQRLPLPADAHTRTAVEAVSERLAQVVALDHAGAYEAAVVEAREVVEAADETGWPPIAAEARLRLGEVLDASNRLAEAEDVLADAYFRAGAVAADAIAEDAAIELVQTIGFKLARPPEALRWAEHAKMARARRGETDESLRAARLEHVLGMVHEVRGDFDASLRHHSLALAMQERLLGAEHLQVAGTLGGIGSVLYDRGEYDAAIESHRRALAIREHVLGGDHPLVASSLNNIASTELARGRYDDALPPAERALAIRERALGPDALETAKSLNNLGAVHKSRGDLDRAEEFHRRALAIRELRLGPDHPDVAGSLQNVALVLSAQRRHDDALVLLRRAHAISERTHGGDHHDTARALMNVGNAERSLGRLDDAEASFARSLAIWERALGAEHPDVARALSNLGEVARERGRLDDAREYHRRALAIREKTLGADHPHVAYTLVDLGTIDLEDGRPADAVPRLERALAIQQANAADERELAPTRVALERALAQR
jgi:tetratricopeptide (TPR) repeat protein